MQEKKTKKTDKKNNPYLNDSSWIFYGGYIKNMELKEKNNTKKNKEQLIPEQNHK